jgi:uncharacterized phage infection (PIP) family protein YhgE
MATVNDELWSLGQRSRGLTEFLSALRIIWNDSAAHEISTRYLVPRSDDDQRMQRALADQQNALEELQSHVATVMELASAAEGLSQNIAQLLRETLQEVSTANGYYQSFSEFNNNALNLFPQISQQISAANSSCAGIAANMDSLSFASQEKLTDHFERHGPQMGYQTEAEYLTGARNLIKGGEGVRTFTRQSGEVEYYKPQTNEYAVVRSNGVIKTYFAPDEGAEYVKWL